MQGWKQTAGDDHSGSQQHHEHRLLVCWKQCQAACMLQAADQPHCSPWPTNTPWLNVAVPAGKPQSGWLTVWLPLRCLDDLQLRRAADAWQSLQLLPWRQLYHLAQQMGLEYRHLHHQQQMKEFRQVPSSTIWISQRTDEAAQRPAF